MLTHCARSFQVLCLHIKRFRWCNSYRSKVDTQVDFPMESLDMSAFTVRGVTGTRLGAQNSHLYDLAAVIVHHGSGYASLRLEMCLAMRKHRNFSRNSCVTSIRRDKITRRFFEPFGKNCLSRFVFLKTYHCTR